MKKLILGPRATSVRMVTLEIPETIKERMKARLKTMKEVTNDEVNDYELIWRH